MLSVRRFQDKKPGACRIRSVSINYARLKRFANTEIKTRRSTPTHAVVNADI